MPAIIDVLSKEIEKYEALVAQLKATRDAIRATEGGSAAPAPAAAAKKRGRPAKAAKGDKAAANGSGKKRGRPRKVAAPAEAPAAAE
jgi:hypothetical protein